MSSERIGQLVREHQSDTEIWKRMAFDQYANYVLQKIIERAPVEEKKGIYLLIKDRIDQVKTSVRRRLLLIFANKS